MSKEGMTLTVLATGLAEAVLKDEAPDAGGFDLSAGLFGEHVSAWLREVASEICTPVEAAQRNLRDAENWRMLRELLGYVENGSEDVVTISQDDATRDWCVHVGPSHRQRTFYDSSLIGALKKASGL